MNTEQFFAHILPDVGLRAIINITNKRPRQTFHRTNADAAAKAHILDVAPAAVYHGCATFKDGKSRKAENVHSVKAFWLDLDCGEGKHYTTIAEMGAALKSFRAALSLTPPTIVMSGRGFHVYWTLLEAITPAEWHTTAQALKSAASHFGLHADPTRTADIASVLRPAGTHHRKDAPVEVRVVRVGTPSTYQDFNDLVTSYCFSNNVLEPGGLTGDAPHGLPVDNSDLIAPKDYGPPPLANDIAANCAHIRHFRDSQGTMPEPHWRAAMGVVRLCEDGEAVCHDWSSGHPSYSYAETAAKLKGLAGTGGTHCTTLESFDPSLCNGCLFRGTCVSPISTVKKSIAVIVQAPATVGAPVSPTNPLITTLKGFVGSGKGKGIWAQIPDKSKPGTNSTVNALVTTAYLEPIGCHEISSGSYGMTVRLHVEHGNKTRDFQLPGEVIADTSALMRALGKQMVTAKKNMSQHLAAYLNQWFGHLRQTITPTQAYSRFGWHTANPVLGKSFLHGNTMLHPDGSEESVVLTGSAAAYQDAMVPQGRLDLWVKSVDRAYNHPGLEPMQFIVVAGFASVLLHMFRDYGGVTLYSHSDLTGKGKTTAARTAFSAWGDWTKLQLTDKLTTQNALYATLGTLSHIPLIYDELTNKPDDEVGEMVHLISSGRPKQRCDQHGNVLNKDQSWQTFVLASGNLLLSEKVSQHRAHAEAEVARIWEFEMKCEPPVGAIEAMQLFPTISDNQGHAGRAFAKYVVENYADVNKFLIEMQVAISTKANISQGERYWNVMLACVSTAMEICRTLDILKFPVAPFEAFLMKSLAENRGGLSASVTGHQNLLTRMLQDLWPGMIVTAGPGDLVKGQEAFVLQSPSGPVKGRVVVRRHGTSDTEYVLVPENIAKAWCGKMGVSARSVFKEALAAGMLESGGPVKRSLASGTTQFAALGYSQPCWVIKFNSGMATAVGGAALVLVKGGKP